MTKVKSFLHKLIGLYLIGWFTTLWLIGSAGSVLAGWGAGWGWVGFYDPSKSNGIAVGGAGTDTGDNIVEVIKKFMNIALSFVTLIAFWFLLRWGYKMVMSGWDEEGYKEGVQILKNAAIGIAFIAVSWFLVTGIFWVVTQATS